MTELTKMWQEIGGGVQACRQGDEVLLDLNVTYESGAWDADSRERLETALLVLGLTEEQRVGRPIVLPDGEIIAYRVRS